MPEPGVPTIAELVERHLQLGMDDICQELQERKRYILGGFAAAFGERTVDQLKAIDIAGWLASHETWRSPWTYNAALQIIRRMFNWAIESELVERNPSQRVKLRRKTTQRRPMSDEHFQALMRTADAIFRRFLVALKFTGARPSELTSARWRNVNFEQGAIVLHEHKTAKKTGRPRIIPLVPPVVKLLAWMRSHRQATVIGLVERFLLDAGGDIKAVELARKMKPYGVSARAVARAREALGLEKVWCEGPGRAKGTRPTRSGGPPRPAQWGHWRYRLPADYAQLPDPTLHDFVFVNALGNAFNKRSLTLRMQRLRVRAGLPKGITLYTLRHRFAFQGVRNGVNLKLLSLALGHTSVVMSEKYVWSAGLADDVQQAALQIVYGEGAIGLKRKAPPPHPIEIVTPPPVGEIPIVSEHVPSRANTERERPQVRVHEQPTNGAIETLLAELVKRLPAPKMNGRHSGPALILPLRPAEEATWKAVQWALVENPALASAKDVALFAWLKSRTDCPHSLPPHVETFRRYLSKGRLFYDQRKRVLRGRELPPIPPEEAAV
jgi:integrase